MTRAIRSRYEDPLDRVWTACAERIGLRVVRTGAAYASYDGQGTLALGTAATLDADDCVAQMVFHEICHALVQRGAGVDAFGLRDWGLDNRSQQDEPRERATLRLQAELARRHGLRRLLAPTTDHRGFFDALPEDPLRDAPAEERQLAVAALRCAMESPFSPHLEAALSASATIVRAAAPFHHSGTASLFDAP